MGAIDNLHDATKLLFFNRYFTN
ncbi:hypothetical protein CBM2589_A70250 [Cupriavidus taiwanensis]|uniref:Uncharacterized protein n=1 Tax=Cupriavidus taiwanensis TaxID=164546 RepID=A0A375C7L8_9BURK|nr:hypothetical protein CBM2589_A70250 [Cupriavidus taiwanensis]